MSQTSPPRLLLWGVLTAGVSAISASAILIRLTDAPGISTALFRTVISAVLMAIIAQLSVGSGWWKLTGREKRICAVSGFFLAMHFWSWMTSLEYTTVASAVLFVTMNPIFVGLAAPVVTGDKLTPRLWGGIALAMVGSLVVGYDDLSQGPSTSLLGNFLALLGAICGSGYLLAGRLARKTVGLESYATFTNATAALCLLPIALIVGAPLWDLPPATYGMFLLIAIIPQLIGHNSLVWSLKHLSAPVVSLVILAEPIGSGLLALIFFKEYPSGTKLLGAAILLCGIFVASLTSKPSQDDPDDDLSLSNTPPSET